MVEVIVIAEGQTEEQFIKRLIAPALRYLRMYIKPQLLNTSKDSKGGAISFDRLKFNARNTLRNKPEVFLSTFLDLYGLATDFLNLQNGWKICCNPSTTKPGMDHLQLNVSLLQPWSASVYIFVDGWTSYGAWRLHDL